jgi:hypothetical protein
MDDPVWIVLKPEHLKRAFTGIPANTGSRIEHLLPCGIIGDFVNDENVLHRAKCCGKRDGRSCHPNRVKQFGAGKTIDVARVPRKRFSTMPLAAPIRLPRALTDDPGVATGVAKITECYSGASLEGVLNF